MTRLPLTVISGYLGAGKTTLINQLLSEPHGLKLMVLVNDFGAINIDYALISRRSKDVIALTNGCVCCTMGADLFMALGDALDRRPRPDHLIIEASGIADPLAIANAAKAEPDLSYAGIMTLVDASNIEGLLTDPLIGPQVLQQIKVADLVLLTKAKALPMSAKEAFDAHDLPEPVSLGPRSVSDLFLSIEPNSTPGISGGHVDYVSWSYVTEKPMLLETLRSKIDSRPKHLFRLKGFVATEKGTFEVQVVGDNVEIIASNQQETTTLVGIGMGSKITVVEIDDWWR